MNSNEPTSICSTKIVLKNDLISDDPAIFLLSGHDAMLVFLKYLLQKDTIHTCKMEIRYRSLIRSILSYM